MFVNVIEEVGFLYYGTFMMGMVSWLVDCLGGGISFVVAKNTFGGTSDFCLFSDDEVAAAHRNKGDGTVSLSIVGFRITALESENKQLPELLLFLMQVYFMACRFAIIISLTGILVDYEV